MKNMSVFTESKALRLAETSNPAYMTLEMVVTNDQVNLNGDRITKEALEANAETLVDMPVQVDRDRLEKGLYSSLTHKASKEGLKTESVGVVTKVWLETDEETDVTTMYASAKIWKRYVATCEAIAELYEDDNLKFSWELVSTDYVKAEDGTREHNDFYFMGHCIVSMPSYPVAKAQLLVAELTKGSDEQSEVNGLEEYLIAGMSASMLRGKVDSKLMGGWVTEIFVEEGKVIVRDWTEDKTFLMSYTLDGEDVTLLPEKVEVALTWTPVDQVQESDLRIAELEKENEELKAQLAESVKAEEPKEECACEGECQCEKAEVKEEVKAESDDKVIAYAEAIATLTETVATLQSHIAELEPYRLEAVRLAEEKAQAEIEAKKAELKVMTEKVVAELTAEMLDAIEAQDEKTLKLLIADYAIANVKGSDSIVAEKQEDVVIATATKDEEYAVKKDKTIRLY